MRRREMPTTGGYKAAVVSQCREVPGLCLLCLATASHWPLAWPDSASLCL